MIPKIIHYCWFGKNPKPKYLLKYIRTWENKLDGYEFVEWNESNFDINGNLFTKQAYENKKFAFVSDFVRLYAVFHFGGIYLDTDVEVLESFNGFLNKNAFIGFEGDSLIGTAVIGAQKNNDLIGLFLKHYQNRAFVKDNGELDQTPNTHIIANILIEKGLLFNGNYQVIDNSLEIFPQDYFSAKSFSTGEVISTSNTVSVHHFACSWFPWHIKLRIQLSHYLKTIQRNFYKKEKK